MKNFFSKALIIVLAVTVGLIILKINESGLKWIIYFTGLLLAILFIVLISDKKKFLLIIFFITIPLNIYKHLGDITLIGTREVIFNTGWESLFYFSINELLLFILFLIFIADIIVANKKIVLYKADLPFIAFFCIAVLSILLNFSTSDYGLREIRKAFFFLLIYYYFSRNFDSKEHLYPLLYTMLGILTFECLVSFGQLVGIHFSIFSIFGSNDGTGNVTFYTSALKRIWGTFSGPNPFASFLVLILPIVLSGGFIVKNKMHRIFFFAAYCLGIIIVFFTYSRGAWFSLIIQIIIFLWFGRNILPKWVYNKGLWLIIFILISIMISFKIEEILFRLVSQESNNSSITRLTQTKVAFYYFINSPLFGIGAGNYTNRLSVIDRLLNVSSYGLPVHNIYFLNLAQIGILGLTAYLWQYFISIKKIIKNINAEYNIFYLCILMSLCGHIFHNTVDLAEVQPDISSMVYLLFGLTINLFINSIKNNNLQNSTIN